MNEITNGVAAVTNAVASATSVQHESVFNGLDWFVIALFAVGMIAVVVFSMRKKNESGKDYFLSGRDPHLAEQRAPTPGKTDAPHAERCSLVGNGQNPQPRARTSPEISGPGGRLGAAHFAGTPPRAPRRDFRWRNRIANPVRA